MTACWDKVGSFYSWISSISPKKSIENCSMLKPSNEYPYEMVSETNKVCLLFLISPQRAI